MRILVTISRDWDNYDAIDEALIQAVGERIPTEYPDVTVVHGASQMDWFVAGVAYGFGMELEAHPANWRIGKAAGFLRNQEMVDAGADLCLAFIKNGSHGASHCAERAEKAGIPTRRYTA